MVAGVKSFKGKGVSAAAIMPGGCTWVGASGVSDGTTAIMPEKRLGTGSIGFVDDTEEGESVDVSITDTLTPTTSHLVKMRQSQPSTVLGAECHETSPDIFARYPVLDGELRKKRLT